MVFLTRVLGYAKTAYQAKVSKNLNTCLLLLNINIIYLFEFLFDNEQFLIIANLSIHECLSYII